MTTIGAQEMNSKKSSLEFKQALVLWKFPVGNYAYTIKLKIPSDEQYRHHDLHCLTC